MDSTYQAALRSNKEQRKRKGGEEQLIEEWDIDGVTKFTEEEKVRGSGVKAGVLQ